MDLTGYAKSTRVMDYTFELPEAPKLQFIYTLTKPSNNFSLKITLRWINGDGEDDWYTVTADVVNGVLTNKNGFSTPSNIGSRKLFTFKGIQGNTTSRPTNSIYYNNGVITYEPVVCLSSAVEQVRPLINYDPNDTYFIESVAYMSDIPNDLINETTLTTTLNDYVLKSENDELKTKIMSLENENNELKQMISSISSQLNQLMNDVYTKNESDERYLNKNNVINELNYSRTDIETLGDLNTSFTFTNIEAGDLKDGFVFSFYNTSITTEPPPIISHKYLFEYEMNEQYYVYISEDKSIRLFIYILPRTDNMNHFIYLRDINNGYAQISKYVKYEWYLESGYKFDSSNVYCREIVDAVLSPFLQE